MRTATTLADNCYNTIFSGRTSLVSATCLATDISATDCINRWLANIQTTGILYVDPSMTDAEWVIPETWSVQAVA